MKTRTANKPSHVTKGNVFEDLKFSPDEAAVMALKVQLHSEIIKAVKRQKLSPRQLEKVLDVPQPRVSELLSGKVSKMTSDKLAKYLSKLGRSVQIKTKKSEGLQRIAAPVIGD